MALGIGSVGNTSSLFAMNAMRVNSLLINKNIAQLSSGNRLINAGIDPSGLAISQMFRSQISGIDQAVYNAQDTVNLTRTADSTLANQQDVLVRMRDLAVRSSNEATLTDADRANLDAEYQSLKSELTRSGNAAQFNTKDLLNGTYGTQAAQVGPDNSPDQQLDVTLDESTSNSMGLAASDVSNVTNSQNAIDEIDTALEQVSNARVDLGVTENRLQYATNDLYTQRINNAAANSRIADTDFALTISSQVRAQLLNQVSLSALSQSNAQGFGVLKLLGMNG